MASLEPFLAAPSRISFEASNKSKPSISILQSRQLITDLENTLGKDEQDTVSCDRQVNSGVIVDFKTFEEGSHAQQHLIARNGENQENVLFSLLILEKEEGSPSKVIYRWIKRLQAQVKGLTLKEEEHIYKGEMRNDRKHGEGEYIILRKWSDCSQTRLKFCGTWTADIFKSGTYENEKGEEKKINQTIFTTFNSRSNIKAKPEKNLTIKLLTEEMGRKKSSNNLKQRDSNVSCASILNKMKVEKGDSEIHTIRLI